MNVFTGKWKAFRIVTAVHIYKRKGITEKMQFKDFRIIFACTQQAKSRIKTNFGQTLAFSSLKRFTYTAHAGSPNVTV